MIDLTKFVISDTKYLKINPEKCIHDDECKFCASIDIGYIDSGQSRNILFGYENFRSFCYFITEYGYIQKLIHGEMVLSDRDAQNIGIEWNQYCEGIIKDTEVDQYLCWSNSHKQVWPYFNSWLYNDENGNVVFEITPFYPWHGKTKKTNPEKISCKEWIKTYKPILKTTIPKDSLKQWIVQAKELEKIYFPEFQKS